LACFLWDCEPFVALHDCLSTLEVFYLPVRIYILLLVVKIGNYPAGIVVLLPLAHSIQNTRKIERGSGRSVS
jgi:hypothetical protein